MNTHELLLDINNGEFIGTSREVMEYLKLPQSKKITLLRKANNNQEIEGKLIKVAGVVKHKMVYGVIDQDEILVATGHADELSKKFYVSPDAIQNAVNNKFRVQGIYRIERIGIEDVIEYGLGYKEKIAR